MKYLILSLSFFLFLNVSIAQQTGIGLNLGVRLSGEHDENKIASSSSAQYSITKYRRMNIDLFPGLSWMRFTKSNNLFFAQVANVRFDKERWKTMQVQEDETVQHITNGNELRMFSSGLNIGYGFPLSTANKNSFYVGPGISSIFNRVKNQPLVNAFEIRETGLLSYAEVFAMYVKELNSSLKLTLYVPLKVYSYDYVWNRHDTPGSSQRQQKYTRHSDEFFPLDFEFQFGLVYVFDKKEK